MNRPDRLWRVAEGVVKVYRLFDVADALDLSRAEAILTVPRSRKRLEGARGPTALEIPHPPLHVVLGRREVPFAAGSRIGEASAHLFDYGVVSIVYELEIAPGTDLAELVPLSEALVVDPNPALDLAARAEAERLARELGPALTRPHAWEGLESHQIVFVRRFEREVSAGEVLADAPLAELLLGETSPRGLSRSEREDVLKHAHSYLEDDLAVVDWNSSFVLEPSAVGDIPDLLELATAHLLELRYYDALLDRELSALYPEIDARRTIPKVFTRRYLKLQNRTAALLLEISEMTERVENAVKIVGDFYLARVYQSAVRRFRLPAWQDSVLRKHKLLADVNELLKDTADQRRGELLELTVILLILWEILYAFLRH
ncbi:MAG TPA: hypothetical protein VLV17_00745 [Anaeromyxobacteraceae bacterium]|nr:hypothetical protein [Anaeromyxobacteraceae bacterium]